MDTQSLFSSDQFTLDFSDLPLSSERASVCEYGCDCVAEPALEASNLTPVLRKLLPWVVAQVAVAIGLGTCLAQAMAPIASKTVLVDEISFPLRLNSAEFVPPIPSGIQDGFHFRFGSID